MDIENTADHGLAENLAQILDSSCQQDRIMDDK